MLAKQVQVAADVAFVTAVNGPTSLYVIAVSVSEVK